MREFVLAFKSLDSEVLRARIDRRCIKLKVKIYVISAFCKENNGGNRAGVVLFCNELTEEQKKAISNRLGYAETAFVTKSNQADFRLEYFTPKEEVSLCGHATIATFALLKHLTVIVEGEYTIETKAGILSVSIGNDMVLMEQSKPQYFEMLEKNEVVDCFNMDCISEIYPIQIVSTGLRDIILPIRDEEALHSMNPNFGSISELSRKYDVVGIHAFALSGDRIICRNFAPLYDVPEESATGTANCALASYLYKHEIIRKSEYVIEQGHSLNSPSEIIVRLVESDGEISRVFVGGYGCFVKEMEMEV